MCFLPIVWIFSTSSTFILTGKTAAAKGCPLGTAVLFTPFPHRDDIGKSSEEWCAIKGNMEQRACDLALYVIESRGTVRSAAKKFGISKSTVHKDLSERLPAFNRGLYLQVKQVLEENKAQRHIRGGLATHRKYKGE